MKIQLRELMHRPVIAVAPTDTVADVCHKMLTFHVRHVVVVDDGRPWGIVSDRDLRTRGLSPAAPAADVARLRAMRETTAAEVATRPVVTASADDDAADAARRMIDHRIGSVVVVEHDHPVGMVTTHDFLAVFATGRLGDLESREALWRRSLRD